MVTGAFVRPDAAPKGQELQTLQSPRYHAAASDDELDDNQGTCSSHEKIIRQRVTQIAAAIAVLVLASSVVKALTVRFGLAVVLEELDVHPTSFQIVQQVWHGA